MIVNKTDLCLDKILRTFTGMGYDTNELDGEMVALLCPACGLSLPSVTSTSVPDPTRALFLGGAAVADVNFIVLGFNACFQFLTSGIVFNGNMSAI